MESGQEAILLVVSTNVGLKEDPINKVLMIQNGN